MKRTIILASISVLCLLQTGWGQVPRTISYQGVLKDNNDAIVTDGQYDLTFRLFDVVEFGTPLWSEDHTADNSTAVTVTDGVFSVILGSTMPLSLNFDSQYWLEIVVGTTPLLPRTRLTASPYSFYALRADTAQYALSAPTGGEGWSLTGNSGTVDGTNFLGTSDNVALELKVNSVRALRLEPHTTSPNVIGGHNDNNVTTGVMGATIGGGGKSGYVNQVTANYGTVGGGSNNRASNNSATIGGGSSNDASGFFATVAGGNTNTASGNRSAVGGGVLNTASGSYAAVGGGINNIASGSFSTNSGGQQNTASGQGATISGGEINTASGDRATVGGGLYNRARGLYAVVSGGGGASPVDSNAALGNYSTVGGGTRNKASGYASTVPGGVVNVAAGGYSFAAGRRAKANHNGAFVWADSSANADFASTAADQFLIRAAGGVGIGTESPAEQLDVAGTVRMTGFKLPTGAASGYVLTSDASGLGTWQAAPGGGANGWVDDGTVVRLETSMDNVGIGTDSPNAAAGLHIERGNEAATTYGLYVRNTNTGTMGYGVVSNVNFAGGTTHTAFQASAAGATNN